MPTIFVSYRRFDSQDVTGRIYDRLVGKFTSKQVFKDVDSIPLGVSFPAHIRQLLSKANVVLVVIGPNWLTATDEQGKRRLDDPNDFVRLEVEIALRADMPVIPVLVSGARMPQASELPGLMKSLASRNGIQVRPDPDFNNDMARLFSGLDHLEKLLAAKTAKPAAAAPAEIGKALPAPSSPKSKAVREKSKSRPQEAERSDPASVPRPTRTFAVVANLAVLAVAAVATGSYVYWGWLSPSPRPSPPAKDLVKDTLPKDGFNKTPVPFGWSLDTAHALAIDGWGQGSANGSIDSTHRSVYYRITATRTGFMLARASFDKERKLDIRIRVYDGNKNELPSDNRGSYEDSTSCLFPAVSGRTYFVEVYSQYGEAVKISLSCRLDKDKKT